MLATPLARSAIAVAMALLVSACSGTTATPSPTVAPTTAPTVAPTPTPTVAASPTATPAPTLLPIIEANTTKIALTKIPIPPIAGKTASIDIIEIDQAAHLMYVTDRTDTGLDIFDVSTATAKYVKTIDMGSPPNGVSVAKNVNKVFVTTNDSNVAIIDIDPASAKYQTILLKLNTGGKMRADELDYDSKDKKVYVANSDDGIVTVIDAVANTIIKKFENLGEGLEQPRYNSGDGMMYMTGSGGNVVFQFDPTKDVMVKKTDIGVKCNPNGLGINPATNQALLGCSAGRTGSKDPSFTVAWDLTAGKVIAQFDQAGAGDAVFFSAKAGRFFFGASNFNRGGMLAIFSADPIKFITNVPTAVGAHGVAYDETNNVVYTQDQLPNEGALFSFIAPK